MLQCVGCLPQLHLTEHHIPLRERVCKLRVTALPALIAVQQRNAISKQEHRSDRERHEDLRLQGPGVISLGHGQNDRDTRRSTTQGAAVPTMPERQPDNGHEHRHATGLPQTLLLGVQAKKDQQRQTRNNDRQHVQGQVASKYAPDFLPAPGYQLPDTKNARCERQDAEEITNEPPGRIYRETQLRVVRGKLRFRQGNEIDGCPERRANQRTKQEYQDTDASLRIEKAPEAFARLHHWHRQSNRGKDVEGGPQRSILVAMRYGDARQRPHFTNDEGWPITVRH